MQPNNSQIPRARRGAGSARSALFAIPCPLLSALAHVDPAIAHVAGRIGFALVPLVLERVRLERPVARRLRHDLPSLEARHRLGRGPTAPALERAVGALARRLLGDLDRLGAVLSQ